MNLRKLFVRLLLAAMTAAAPWVYAAEGPFENKQFSQLLSEGKPVVVHFHSPWCGTCRQQAKVLTELLKRADLQPVTVLRADFGGEKALRDKLKVQSRSTLVVFKNGKEAARGTGETSAAEIEKLLRSAL